MKIRHFLLFALLGVVLVCTGCTGGTRDHLAYRERDVCLVIEGTVRGFAFSAELCRVSDASGKRDTLRYLAPASLAEVTLTRDPDGGLRLSSGELLRVCGADEVEGMLLPIRLLFDTPADVETIRRTADGCTQLTLTGGITMTLSPDGLPTALLSPDASLKITEKR